MDKLKSAVFGILYLVGLFGTPFAWALAIAELTGHNSTYILGAVIGGFVSYWAYHGLEDAEIRKRSKEHD